MRTVLWLAKWLLRAAIFFTLFAFALNNPHLVQVNWFFGHAWQAPLVLVVLVIFAVGVFVGALGMAPRWWRQRKRAQAANQLANQAAQQSASTVQASERVAAASVAGSSFSSSS
jgi:lipopolysaccharide assembly protein A